MKYILIINCIITIIIVMDNNLMITLKTIKLLNSKEYFNNDKICELYKRLFDKSYSLDIKNTLFLEIWLNHITEQLTRTADLLSNCEKILNFYEYEESSIIDDRLNILTDF